MRLILRTRTGFSFRSGAVSSCSDFRVRMNVKGVVRVTYHFANRTFHSFLTVSSSAAATDPYVAGADHAEDRFFLETVRALLTGYGVPHG